MQYLLLYACFMAGDVTCKGKLIDIRTKMASYNRSAITNPAFWTFLDYHSPGTFVTTI